MHDENNFRYIGNNEVIELTVNENSILKLFIKNKDNITTFDEIAQAVYECNSDIVINIKINQAVCRLRRKLKNEIQIYSKRGFGYFI